MNSIGVEDAKSLALEVADASEMRMGGVGARAVGGEARRGDQGRDAAVEVSDSCSPHLRHEHHREADRDEHGHLSVPQAKL